MRIAMACDHAGTALKNDIAAWLREEGHEVVDFGAYDEQPADLPDHVYPASLAVARGECERGIFVDGVGYGSAMIANRLPGVYAAVAQDPFCATLARTHSDTNVLCIGGKIIGQALAMEVAKAWMAADWLGTTEEKYARRVAKVVAIAERHVRPL